MSMYASATRTAQPARPTMTGAEKAWYLLMNICFGMGYFSKLPARKALADRGRAELTGAEMFWYVLGCILSLGTPYFVKVAVSRALEQSGQ